MQLSTWFSAGHRCSDMGFAQSSITGCACSCSPAEWHLTSMLSMSCACLVSHEHVMVRGACRLHVSFDMLHLGLLMLGDVLFASGPTVAQQPPLGLSMSALCPGWQCPHAMIRLLEPATSRSRGQQRSVLLVSFFLICRLLGGSGWFAICRIHWQRIESPASLVCKLVGSQLYIARV